MIVDDDCFNLNVLEALLKRLNFESIKAINGKDAINKLQEIYHNDCNQEIIIKLIIMDY